MAATNPGFQRIRIPPFVQHNFIIVCLQKSCVTLAEMMDHVFASPADIGKNSDVDAIAGNKETVWIARIMELRESGDRKTSYSHRQVRCKVPDKRLFQLYTAIFKSILGNKDRYLVFPDQ